MADNSEEKIDIEKAFDERIKKLEEASERANEAALRLEAASSRNILGGKSDAGQETPKKKVLTPVEFAKSFERGEVNLFS